MDDNKRKWYLTQIKAGKESEDRFYQQFGGTPSTPTQNKCEGWDFDCDGVKIDVKGPKKVRRKDALPNPHYHWLEIKNVAGGLGWLYKQADYFAFESERSWIFVKRTKLIEWLNKNLKKVEVDDPEPYKLYSRKGRKDVLTLVPTVDLCLIAKRIIEKYEHH